MYVSRATISLIDAKPIFACLQNLFENPISLGTWVLDWAFGMPRMAELISTYNSWSIPYHAFYPNWSFLFFSRKQHTWCSIQDEKIQCIPNRLGMNFYQMTKMQSSNRKMEAVTKANSTWKLSKQFICYYTIR